MYKKIYFDMDGVLADFDKGVLQLCGIENRDQATKTEEEDDLMWAKVRDVEHFYDKLDFMPGAREMFLRIYAKYGDRVEILTGIPKERRGIVTAGEDKIKWIHRLLGEEIKVHIVYAEEKKNYCFGPEYVLVDDFDRNINEWKEQGGTGILFKNSEQVNEFFELNGPEYRLVEKLIDKNSHIAFAESCTGGLAAARLVDVPDASCVFDESHITYANKAKIKCLGVLPDFIEKYGVVSEEVACKMAEGVSKNSGAEVGVGISGIAGPTGGTENKPIGMVCFGFFVDGKPYTFTKKFGNIGRGEVRKKAVDFVYEKLNELM